MPTPSSAAKPTEAAIMELDVRNLVKEYGEKYAKEKNLKVRSCN